jgi:hypothetical protein
MYTTINYVFACKCMCMYVHTYVLKHGDCWIHIIKSVWVSVKLGTKMWMVRQASKTLSYLGLDQKLWHIFGGWTCPDFRPMATYDRSQIQKKMSHNHSTNPTCPLHTRSSFHLDWRPAGRPSLQGVGTNRRMGLLTNMLSPQNLEQK